MHEKGMLVILSGPSGCGKDTVIEELKKADKNVVVSISATTRQKRENEEHGKNYYFISEDEFRHRIDSGDMLEYAVYNENYYGTPLAPIKEMLNEGKTVILKIEVQGAAKVAEKLKDDVFSIFLAPPSFDVLRNRLISRNTDSPDAINNRLKIAVEEMKCVKDYTYIVVNDNLATAVSDVLAIFKAESKKTNRNIDFIGDVIKNAKM